MPATSNRRWPALRGGAGADLVFCDVTLDIGALVRGLAAERICTPVVACGIGTDTRRAVDAIRAGAKEYLPLPADRRTDRRGAGGGGRRIPPAGP